MNQFAVGKCGSLESDKVPDQEYSPSSLSDFLIFFILIIFF